MTNPTPDEPGLPELPAADLTGYRDNVAECVFEATTPTPDDAVRWYTAAQMHAYARTALSARPLPSDWVAVPRALLESWRKAFSEEQAAYAPDKLHHVDQSITEIQQVLAAPSAPAEGGDYSACCDTPAYCSSVRRCTAKDAPEPLAQGQCVGVWNGNAAASGEPGGPVNWATGLTYSSFPDGTKLYASPQPAAEAAEDDDGWEANVRYLLDSYPGSIRVREGGGPESLVASLCVTFIKLRNLDKSATPNPPQPSASVGEDEPEPEDWRIGWALAYAGWALYTDDGELQDNREAPFIDFRRDDASVIRKKIAQRAIAKGRYIESAALDGGHESALTQQRGVQLGDFQDKAMAWDSVCEILHIVHPNWHANGLTGMQAAVNTIRSLATTTPQPGAEALREGLTDEDVAVLRRLKAALPTVGLNGWMTGVRVLTKLESLLGRGGK